MAPVDSHWLQSQLERVKKKPTKIEEAKASYPARKRAQAAPASETTTTGARYMDDATFKKAADKVFKVHHELLRKLAQ